MRRISLVLIVWLGCRPPQPTSSVKELIGVWRNQASDHSPEPCQNATIEFRGDDTVLLRTGRQTLTATYAVEPGPSRLVVQQRNLHSNGEPNCQGISSEFVLEHYQNTLYVDVKGDTLRAYRTTEDHEPFMTAIHVR